MYTVRRYPEGCW